MKKESALELKLVTSLLAIKGDKAGKTIARVRKKWFADTVCAQAFAIIQEHYTEHREVIPVEILRHDLPGFALAKEGPSQVDPLIERVQNVYLDLRYQEAVERADEEAESSLHKHVLIQRYAREVLTEVERGEGAVISETMGEALARYRDYKAGKDIVGLPWPWEPLQKVSKGSRPGQYTVLVGRMKSRKTFLALYIMVQWAKKYDRKFLFITREMPREDIQDRLLCIWANVSYERFDQGKLTDLEEQMIEAAAEEIESCRFIVETVEGFGDDAVIEIDGLCEKYDMEEGDVLGVDGLYFYAEKSQWQSMRSFSHGLKQACIRKDRKLHCVATTQGNQELTEDPKADIGKETNLGDGVAQDADLMLKLVTDDDECETAISVGAVRRGKKTNFVINSILCEDFSTKYDNDYDKEADASSGKEDAPEVNSKKQGARTGIPQTKKKKREKPDDEPGTYSPQFSGVDASLHTSYFGGSQKSTFGKRKRFGK